MPWKASSVMEEKVRFVLEYEQDEHTMSELCQRYGIARETGYVWLRRYRQTGVEGLLELNRAPQRHPNQTPPETERAVLELRQAHRRWVPRKLKHILERDQPHQSWPAASTIGELLKREGLVVESRKRRRAAPYTEPLAHADGANRVWCADFKGWFRTSDGERIDPLNYQRCLQPVSVALSGGGEDGHGANQSHLRSGLSRVRDAAGDPHRQRSPVCFLGGGRFVAAGGVVDEAGNRAGADCGRTSGAERTA